MTRRNHQPLLVQGDLYDFERAATPRTQVSAGVSYKTRPDEDNGFRQIIPLCREYTLSRVSPQSRAFAAIPGGTIIGPVIEVPVETFLINMDFKLQFHHPMMHNGHLML